MPRETPTVRTPEQISMCHHIPLYTVFVDPGPTCGLIFIERTPTVQQGTPWSDLYYPLTLPADEAQDYFARFCLRMRRAGRLVTLVIEEYRIYPDKLMIHAGKTIPTAEIIGGFKYLARRMNGRCIENPSQVKQTTQGILKGRGVPLLGNSEHARDAELHMWYTILRIMERTEL